MASRKPKPDKKTNGDDKHTKTVQIMRNVKCQLTPQELADCAERASHIIPEIDAKQASLDNAKRQAKADIEALEAEHRALMQHYRDKAQYRDVVCDAIHNYRTFTVTILRKDTGEVVDERPMTTAEREEAQTELGLEGNTENDAEEASAPA